MVKSVQFYRNRYIESIPTWNISPGAHDLSPDDDEPYSEQSPYRVADAYFEDWRPGEEWTAPKVHVIFHDREKSLVKTDFLNDLPGGWVISRRAAEALAPLLTREGHILPLDVANSEEEYVLWWVPMILNSVDYERSEKWGVGTDIKNYVFNYDRLQGVTAFRPHYNEAYTPEGWGDVYVNEEFTRAWLEAGLTGIEFRSMVG